MAAVNVIVIDTIGWVHFRTRPGSGLATLTQHYCALTFKVYGHGWLAAELGIGPRNGTSGQLFLRQCWFAQGRVCPPIDFGRFTCFSRVHFDLIFWSFLDCVIIIIAVTQLVGTTTFAAPRSFLLGYQVYIFPKVF